MWQPWSTLVVASNARYILSTTLVPRSSGSSAGTLRRPCSWASLSFGGSDIHPYNITHLGNKQEDINLAALLTFPHHPSLFSVSPASLISFHLSQSPLFFFSSFQQPSLFSLVSLYFDTWISNGPSLHTTLRKHFTKEIRFLRLISTSSPSAYTR